MNTHEYNHWLNAWGVPYEYYPAQRHNSDMRRFIGMQLVRLLRHTGPDRTVRAIPIACDSGGWLRISDLLMLPQDEWGGRTSDDRGAPGGCS
jgi:hypothetical protein